MMKHNLHSTHSFGIRHSAHSHSYCMLEMHYTLSYEWRATTKLVFYLFYFSQQAFSDVKGAIYAHETIKTYSKTNKYLKMRWREMEIKTIKGTNERSNNRTNEWDGWIKMKCNNDNKWIIKISGLHCNAVTASYTFKWKCSRIGQIQIVIAYKLCWWGNFKSDLKKKSLKPLNNQKKNTLYKYLQIILNKWNSNKNEPDVYCIYCICTNLNISDNFQWK